MRTFRLTVRLLGDSFHGRGDGGEPEWPPSPLRAFQALVAAAAGRWREPRLGGSAVPALEWLERLPPPQVVAPPGRHATRPYRLYVPNNVGDVVAAAWARGNPDASIAEHRTEKDVRPTRFAEGQAVCFDWPLSAEQLAAGVSHVPTLAEAARSITHLGWGVDQAVGHAALLDGEPPVEADSERWMPGGGVGLRVPRAGTLADLSAKHAAFLGRVSGDRFLPVPPLSNFGVVGYARATDLPARPWAAFTILKPDASGNRAFDAARRTRDVAAWVRHATGAVCAGWPFEEVAGFVHGHDPADNTKPLKGASADRRFHYLPLPTLNVALNRVESIRRVLVVGPPGCEDQVTWVRRRLPGQMLEANDVEWGLLNLLPTKDWVLGQYIATAKEWSTVTPVIWPGHDDRDAKKAEGLLRKAFGQAGLTPEVVAGIEELEWRPVGFRAGLDPAHRYTKPASLTGRAYHVRVRFKTAVAGPLAVGAGRFRGFGLFAVVPDGPSR